MFFSEQVRLIADEEIVLNETNTTYFNTVHDWTTRSTKNVTLTKEKIVYVKHKLTSGSAYGNGRVLLDDVPIMSTGFIPTSTSVTREMYLILPAGSYVFKFQTALWYYASGNFLDNLRYIAALNFSDKAGYSNDSGVTSVPATSTATMITRTFTTPSRKLAVGAIKKYVCWIMFYGELPDSRTSKPKNPGESDEANFLNWKIYLNDVQQSWTDRANDWEAGHPTDNPTYGEGAYGFYAINLDPNTQYTVRIDVYNGYGSAKNARTTMKIIMCPWFIPSAEYEPIAMTFPQGSTLYVTAEPLASDPSKTIRIGKVRFVSFGAPDYYSTSTGTGVLNFNYTFDAIDVSNVLLLISGYGGCVSVLGVDVR